ncbi:MAG: hypothetical protein SPE56_04035 [Prevotella sp.]|nr:hypothetical protein [Prevotella sp.]
MNRTFRIADHYVTVSTSGDVDSLSLLPSFRPFVCEPTDNGERLFSITLDDSLQPVPKSQREHVHDFDTGNGVIKVDDCADGGSQFIIRDINDAPCALLIAEGGFRQYHCALNGSYNMRSFGLNSAMMLAFAQAGALAGTLLLHASLVRQNGWGYAFTAKSGTGKSTQVANWLRYLPDCDMMNDDNPVVRMIDGKPVIYGSPWSGKTPCYRNVQAPLGALTLIDRAKTNSVEKLDPLTAFTVLLPAISSMKWNKMLYQHQCDTVIQVISSTDCYTLHCLPDRESAVICNQTIRKA